MIRERVYSASLACETQALIGKVKVGGNRPDPPRQFMQTLDRRQPGVIGKHINAPGAGSVRRFWRTAENATSSSQVGTRRSIRHASSQESRPMT